MTDPAQLKADLLAVGKIFIPEELVLPSRASHSSAGPGVAGCGYIFSIEGRRVRLTSAPREETPYELAEAEGGFAIVRDGAAVASGVKVEPIIYHTSNQAFINLDTRCRFDCAFCDTTELERQGKGIHRELPDVLDMVARAMETGRLEGVALTTGIPNSAEDSARYIAGIATGLKSRWPELSIGVETLVDSKQQLEALKAAGVEEVKLNMEAATRELLEKVCPQMDRQRNIDMLRIAVDVFGRNKVTSNIIYGLGERRREVVELFEQLAAAGVVPNLRRLRVTEWNRTRLEKSLGHIPGSPTASETLELARDCASILDKHGLDPHAFKTMCLNCGACDLTPILDVGGAG